jgi:hypothetical protein
MAFQSFNYQFTGKVDVHFAALFESDYDNVLDATQNTLWEACCCYRSRCARSADRYEMKPDGRPIVWLLILFSRLRMGIRRI